MFKNIIRVNLFNKTVDKLNILVKEQEVGLKQILINILRKYGWMPKKD